MNSDSVLWSKRRELLALGAMVSIYFLSYFQRTAVPGTIFNQLQSDMRLSASGVTALGAVCLYIYACAQIFVGITADRFGGGRTLVFGGLVMAAGAVMFPLAHTPWEAYASRAVTGLGASFMYLSIVKEVDALFGARLFPVLIGPMLFGGYCGGLAATSPFNWAATVYGWRPALLAVGVLTFALVGLTWLVLHKLDHPVPSGRTLSLRPLLTILRQGRNWPLLICAFINYPSYFVFQSTLGKKLLEDSAGMSASSAAHVLFVMMAVSAGLTFFSGPFLRLTGHRRRPLLTTVPVLVLTGIGLLWFAVAYRAPGGVFVAGCVVLASASAVSPVGITTMKELNDPDTVAQSVAVLNGMCYLGVAVLANVAGVVLDRFADQAAVTATGMIYPPAAYTSFFAILAVLGVVSLVSSRLIPETRGKSAHVADSELG